jgi:hypothetical protein
MNKIKLIILALLALILMSCADAKTIDGKTYQTYGFMNQEDKSDSIQYKASLGSLVVGVVFFETIVVPIYVFGYDFYEPVAKK